jgi:hypothetical protein
MDFRLAQQVVRHLDLVDLLKGCQVSKRWRALFGSGKLRKRTLWQNGIPNQYRLRYWEHCLKVEEVQAAAVAKDGLTPREFYLKSRCVLLFAF